MGKRASGETVRRGGKSLPGKARVIRQRHLRGGGAVLRGILILSRIGHGDFLDSRQPTKSGAPAGIGAARKVRIGLIGAGSECDASGLVTKCGNRNRTSEECAEGTYRKGVGPCGSDVGTDGIERADRRGGAGIIGDRASESKITGERGRHGLSNRFIVLVASCAHDKKLHAEFGHNKVEF